MKQIYTLLAATLMLAGTALWSGCSNNELLENEKPGTEKPGNQQAAGFKFSLKGMAKTNTRATAEELTKENETKINTLYVAFFLNDGNGKEENYQLHKIFAYDDKATDAAWTDATITKTADTEDYVIASPGIIGDYVVYFIANPDADMKANFAKFQLSAGSGAELQTRTKLSDFEALKAKSGTADGTVEEGSPAAARGFIMLAKQSITLSTSATTVKDINLTRLAARFDFINSAAATTDSKVKITKITINNAAQQSRLMELADISQEELKAQEVTLTDWTDQTAYISAYTYENLNLKDANASNRLSIDIEYELTAGASAKANMTKKVQLKVGESDLAVLRNHIYRIYMNGVTGEFSVEVQDWNVGATVTMPDENLDIVYTAKDLGKVGDYVYVTAAGGLDFSDGGLRKACLNGTLEWDADFDNIRPVADKGTCVGFVFSTRVSEKDKASGWTGGYAIAPQKVDVGSMRWAYGTYATADNPNISTAKYTRDMVKDMDGYSNCQAMETDNTTTYPVYNAMKEEAKKLTALPSETSGWYMPSVGQLMDFFYNLAGATTIRTRTNDYDFTTGSGFWGFTGANYTLANRFSQRINNGDLVGATNYIDSSSEISKDYFVRVETSGQQGTGSVVIYRVIKANGNSKNECYFVFAFTKPDPQP
ncbi:fimbrial protein [Bacteroides sp.]|uniref:fimbrial protein n=1 Tax=Bacteroides sp. TaxID=29523 RepID=UPI003AB47B2C